MSLATPSCVQKSQTASHASFINPGGVGLFRERMREICLSGPTSGNRKQVKLNRIEAGHAKASQQPPGG
jgi:hypothetical protein